MVLLYVWLAIFLFLVQETVGAAAIGMVPETVANRFGYALGGAHVTVEDPAGPAGEAWVVQPISLVFARNFDRSTRVWTEAFYQEAALEATTARIGQSVRRLGVLASLEKRAALHETWQPWFGMGLDLSYNRFTARHLVDEEAYLSRTFPDRSEVNLGVVFSAKMEWALNAKWDAGVTLAQAFPLGNGVESSSLALVFLYRGNLAGLAR